MSIEVLHPWEYPHTSQSSPAELEKLLNDGVLDLDSFNHYQSKHDHFVELTHRDSEGNLKSLRLSGNLRNNPGGDWQALLMGGDVAFGDRGTATATSATSLTDTAKAWTFNQWLHHAVYAGPNTSGTGSSALMPILSSNASSVTGDQWYASKPNLGITATTTPNATSVYQIGPGIPLRWLALSTNAASPSSGDTSLTGEITNADLARAEGTFAHSLVSGGTASSTQTSTYTLAKTFTATNTYTAIQKASLFYSGVASTGTAMFENTFSSVNMISGDTLAVTWTVNC